MTPFEHLLAATEQRVANARAATGAGRPDDLNDLTGLVRDLCQSAIDERHPVAFDRMVALLARLRELETETRVRLDRQPPASRTLPAATSAGVTA